MDRLDHPPASAITIGDRDPDHDGQVGHRPGRTPRSSWTWSGEFRSVGVNNHRPTIRACIAIARMLSHESPRPGCRTRSFYGPAWRC